MKIAMIGQKGIPARSGGIERHVEELSVELVTRGHEVLVFCRSWYTWPIRDYKGVRCIKTGSIATKHLDTITHTFLSILKAVQEKVDVFHFHGVGPSLLAWIPKLLRPSAKIVVTFHCIDRHHKKWGFIARSMLKIGERIACRIPHATIAVSKTLETYCRLSYGTTAKYIPNGTQILLEDADPGLLKPFDLSPGNYLMMCSRLVRHKGAHTLINAWKQLKQTNPNLVKNKKLAIVGGGAFTESYVKELHKLSKDDPSIILTGNQSGDTLHSLFAHSYAIVHPSESEGLPIAILEAMSYGKCVLSSDIPENKELTQDHGLTFRTNDERDLKEKLAMILENPTLVKAVGQEARLHVAKQYDWKDIAETTEYLYELLWLEPEMTKQHIYKTKTSLQ
ncbi:glycosyltransferase family 4 protein [Candidatus Uhrbacteria bacterium]|nr:glycosyltransferase family 4 protein [Candidatus Uhrbacteria bacterium]